MSHPTNFWILNFNLNQNLLNLEKEKVLQLKQLLIKDTGKKKFLDASHRSIPPQETLAKLKPELQKKAGITRVSDITGLDVIDITTYVAIRPEAYFASPLKEGQISVYNGKGFTKLQAKVSALMEAFERCSGEPFDRKPLIASFNQIKDRIPAVDPNSLNFGYKADSMLKDAPIEWMLGLDLFTQQATAVQATSVFSPYVAPQGTVIIQPRHSTTGLASGNTILEATVHALLEIIERHGSTPHLPFIKMHSIPLQSIKNKQVLSLLRKLQKHKIRVGLKYYKTPLGLPVCRATIDDPMTRDPFLLCYGMGCHLSLDVALIRAITEAVQTRLTVITGIREDLYISDELRNDPLNYDKQCQKYSHYFEEKNPLAYEKIPQFKHSTFQEDLRFILKQLKRCGYSQVIVVNLTRPSLEVPVVRVIVPRLQYEHDLLKESKQGATKKC